MYNDFKRGVQQLNKICYLKQEMFEHGEQLVKYFENDQFKVDTFIFDYQMLIQKDFSDYDFLLLDLLPSIEKNMEIIDYLEKNYQAPLYVFCNGNPNVIRKAYLNQGAEGLIDLPYEPLLLSERIKSVMRFLNQLKDKKDEKIVIGPMTIDLLSREMIYQDQVVKLTKHEIKILKVLYQKKDQVVDKESLISAVWTIDEQATDNALGIHMTRLRKKFKFCDIELIETIWGYGYRFNYVKCLKRTSELANNK